jgi:hypothetical protein
MGKVDKTLFLIRQGDDILIVQVYVDDIVFGGLSHSLAAGFAEDKSKEFKMVYDGRIAVLSRDSNQAGEGRNLCATSQVHEGDPQEVQDGRLEAHVDTDEYNYNTRRRRGRITHGPEGVPEQEFH